MGVCKGRSKPLPYPKIVCFGDRGEVCGNRFKRGVEDVAPYRKTDILVIKVWFAVVAHNGQSRTPVPTNKVFVSVIEVRLAVTVLNGESGTSPPTD